MLPILTTQKLHLHLPCSKQDIEFRPFTAGEDKLFLNLYEKSKGKDFSIKDFMTTLKQVFENCTFQKLNISELPIYDVEWLLLKLRESSKGEEIEVKIPCSNCGHQNPIKYLTTDFNEPRFDENHQDLILLDEVENISVKLRYPSFKSFEKLLNNPDNITLFSECIHSIIKGEEVYYFADATEKEREEFILSMQKKHIDLLEKHFFRNPPKPFLDINFECSKCETYNKYKIEGLLSFFS